MMLMINRKEYRTTKTYEQVDEEIRNELAINKNLVASLKVDLAYAKRKREAVIRECALYCVERRLDPSIFSGQDMLEHFGVKDESGD